MAPKVLIDVKVNTSSGKPVGVTHPRSKQGWVWASEAQLWVPKGAEQFMSSIVGQNSVQDCITECLCSPSMCGHSGCFERSGLP